MACGSGEAGSVTSGTPTTGAADRPGVVGRVTGSGGAPLEGVSIAAASRDQPELPTPQLGVVSDADGRYRWPLPPGRWLLTAAAPSYRAARQTVDVPASGTVTADFRLDP